MFLNIFINCVQIQTPVIRPSCIMYRQKQRLQHNGCSEILPGFPSLNHAVQFRRQDISADIKAFPILNMKILEHSRNTLAIKLYDHDPAFIPFQCLADGHLAFFNKNGIALPENHLLTAFFNVDFTTAHYDNSITIKNKPCLLLMVLSFTHNVINIYT